MDFLVLCPPGGIYVQKHIGKRFAITETTWLRLKVFSKSGIGCSRLNPNYLGTLMLNLRFTEVGVRRSLILVRLALFFFFSQDSQGNNFLSTIYGSVSD